MDSTNINRGLKSNTGGVMIYIMGVGKHCMYGFCKSCCEILVELRNVDMSEDLGEFIYIL